MASWLKVAEDLFEVVDRRAKLVVNELADEQPDSQAPTPALPANGRDVPTRKTRSRGRGNPKQSIAERSPKLNASVVEQEQSNVEIAEPKSLPDGTQAGVSEKPVEAIIPQLVDSNPDSSTDANKEEVEPRIVSSEVPVEVDGKYAGNAATESTASDNSAEHVNGGESVVEKSKNEYEESSSLTPMDQTTISTGDPDSVNSEDSSAAAAAFSRAGDEDGTVPEKMEVKGKDSAEAKAEDIAPRPSLDAKNPEQNNGSPLKVQDQLDEAQGILKTAVSTGQSKEARLARVCAGLSSRLQEYKSENAQLEELLVAERELSISYQARIKELQKDLSLSRNELARVESSMSDALAAKNSEIEALISSTDSLKKQSSTAEEKLSSLQENMDAMMRSRELTETRMMQALREELAVAERRAEEERAAHNATKMAAVEREVELEHRAVEASNALARMQRTADESTSRAMELEHKLALLEVECSTLNQEMQEMEARARRGQKKSSEESNQILQVQVWQEEAERARQSQRDAENKLSFLEAEMQKIRVEMAGMKRDAEHYSRQEHVELEKRYRELTDLLYHKQTQLETMASDKAALEFQLEKEVRRLQEAQAEAERSRISRRTLSAWEEDTDLKTLEPLPLHHRQLAGAREQLQRAVKLLDSGAVRATRFLWRYPYARVVLLFYLVFVHLFLMYLLHRLQEQADNFSANEVAMSMGLGNSSLH